MRKFVIVTVFALCAIYLHAQSTVLIVAQDDVDRALTVHIKAGIERAKSIGASNIILMLNTFGGLVNEALAITTDLGSLSDIRTIAYIPINDGKTGVSWSAGALLAFSCNEIYMESGTSIGSATPVTASAEGGMTAAGEKVVSALRGQIRAIAEKNGYNKDIAEAMVDQEIELYEVRQNGSPILVQEGNIPAGATNKKLFLANDKLLALTAGEMEYFGQAKIVENQEMLFADLGIGEDDVLVIEPNLSDKVLAFLSSQVVSGILLLVGMGGIYFVISQGNFGIAGVAGVMAFSTLFFINTLLGNIGSLEILLVLAGIILIILEIFVIPGFGVAGILGAALLLASLVLMRQDFVWPEISWQWDIFLGNVFAIILSIVGAAVLILVGALLLPNLAVKLPQSIEKQRKLRESLKENSSTLSLKTGDVGVSLTILRPIGRAQFGTIQCQVRTNGEYIDAGKKICVVGKDSFDIIVKEEKDGAI